MLSRFINLNKNKYNPILKELNRIRLVPRFSSGFANLFEAEIEYVDSASFVYMYDEIFINQIYKYISTNQQPFIIDAGANIGLSIIYFKQLFPKSNILAIEADPEIFNVCKNNIKRLGLSKVELINACLWDKEEEVSFSAQGADAGRIPIENDIKFNKMYSFQGITLSRYLDKDIDFLKMDIEGAETKVLMECADKLSSVKNIFVEYHSFKQQPQTLDQVLAILKNANFRVKIQSVGFERSPFIVQKDNRAMDMQLNIFGIRQPNEY